MGVLGPVFIEKTTGKPIKWIISFSHCIESIFWQLIEWVKAKIKCFEN